MDNLINIFMNYKIKYFYDCSILLYEKNDSIITKIIKEYFKTYIDNKYYYTYNTIEGNNIEYSEDNLKLEFDGLEYDLNYEFKEYEDKIKELRSICFEIIKIDKLEYRDLDDLKIKVTNFFNNNEVLNKYISDKTNTLIKLTKDYHNICLKLLNYEDDMFNIKLTNYDNTDNKFYITLSLSSFKGFSNYRKGLVNKVFLCEESLENRKLKCLIQKVSLQLLRDTINNEKSYYFIDLKENNFYKDKIVNSIYKLIDNPLFRKYVVLCVDNEVYNAHKRVFSNGFTYGFMQDFRRIKDIYKKTDGIVNEGLFKYIIVLGCKDTEKKYFLEYKNDNTEILLLKED